MSGRLPQAGPPWNPCPAARRWLRVEQPVQRLQLPAGGWRPHTPTTHAQRAAAQRGRTTEQHAAPRRRRVRCLPAPARRAPGSGCSLGRGAAAKAAAELGAVLAGGARLLGAVAATGTGGQANERRQARWRLRCQPGAGPLQAVAAAGQRQKRRRRRRLTPRGRRRSGGAGRRGGAGARPRAPAGECSSSAWRARSRRAGSGTRAGTRCPSRSETCGPASNGGGRGGVSLGFLRL